MEVTTIFKWTVTSMGSKQSKPPLGEGWRSAWMHLGRRLGGLGGRTLISKRRPQRAEQGKQTHRRARCDWDPRTGMHSSKMSHQHSSGEAGVCQASPTAASTLNIGAKNMSFRKGLAGRGGRWEGPAPSTPASHRKVICRPAPTRLGNPTTRVISLCRDHERNV